MAFPLLAKLGLALLASKMQDDEAKKQHQHMQREQMAKVQADIKAKRAARAGDSGYMQMAMGGMEGMPKAPRSSMGPMLASMGGALLAEQSEPSAPNTPSVGDRMPRQLQWSGGDLWDEDKFRSIA